MYTRWHHFRVHSWDSFAEVAVPIYCRIIAWVMHIVHLISEAVHCVNKEKVSTSCTCNTALVTGGVGGVMGLIILFQSVLVVVLLVIVLSQYNINKGAKRLVKK